MFVGGRVKICLINCTANMYGQTIFFNVHFFAKNGHLESMNFAGKKQQQKTCTKEGVCLCFFFTPQKKHLSFISNYLQPRLISCSE